MTPKEAFTRKKPEDGHLCTFGCLVYCHIPSEKRMKLEPCVGKGIFVGYNDTSKSCRVYIPMLRKAMMRRDVKFDEDGLSYSLVA